MVTSARPCLFALTALLAVAGAFACLPSRRRDRRVDTDLLALFPFTDAGQLVQRIDLATPAADPHLVEGWSRPEVLPTGEKVAWAVARRSRLRFGVRQPADGRVFLRCGLPARTAHRPRQIGIVLNRRRIGQMRVQQGLRDFAFTLPAALLRTGVNELELYNAFVSGRMRAGGRDRSRAFACTSVSFDGLAAGSAPALTPAGDALVIPPGERVDFFVHVPADGALAFDLPGAAARLQVSRRDENGTEHALFDGRSPTLDVQAEVGAEPGDVARLSFASTGERPATIVAPRLLAAGPASAPPAPAGAPARPRNVVLYVIDTLRADHLGCYGYARPTSARIDALGGEGIVFAETVAQASWTRPATASILTGRYPERHGAVTLSQGIRADVPTLAEVLHARGYRTGAFVTNANVSGEYGFRRGFDEYTYLPEDPARHGVHASAEQVNGLALPWLARDRERPFFLYVHATDPHSPYTPPEDVAARFRDPGLAPALPDVPNPVRALEKMPSLGTPDNVAWLAAAYDGEIATTDASLGRLLDGLRELGRWDDTIVVVTADHGEEFKDHGGFEHGYTLYRELTRVPLVVRLPGTPGGRRVGSMARQIDVLPTVLDYAGVPAPEGIDGRSLRAAVESSGPEIAVEALTQTRLGSADLAAVVTPRWKVIARRGGRDPHVEVYDRRTDPGEHTDVARGADVVVGYGRQILAQWAAATARGPAAPNEPHIQPELRQRLQALGYVN